MEMKKIKLQNEGHVYCKSRFYSAQDSLSNNLSYHFHAGINKLEGEIDSGIWALSYLLSMYEHRPQDFILFERPEALVDDQVVHLRDLAPFSCYMDSSYPLFSSKDTTRELVTRGLQKEKASSSAEEIRDLFQIDKERFERPLTGMGNEIFKAMAAIGYCHNKEIFCFPWLSRSRFQNYHDHLSVLLKTLEDLRKIIIVPTGM